MKTEKPLRYFKAMTAAGMLAAAALASWMYLPWPVRFVSEGRECLGDIPLPEGYIREDCAPSSFTAYLRALPLNDSAEVSYFEGGLAEDVNDYAYKTVAMPLLSENEQCADACMHLRADFLHRSRQFRKIHFEDTQHNVMRYRWGARKKKIRTFLRYVFIVSNTESMIGEMPQRSFSDMRPGDVFVYDYKSRPDAKYGHAMMVADVATDPATGEKIFLLVQGSTPACDIHVLVNKEDTAISPWFRLDPDAKEVDFGFARYYSDELRFFDD